MAWRLASSGVGAAADALFNQQVEVSGDLRLELAVLPPLRHEAE